MQEEQLPLINDLYFPNYLESDYMVSESNCHAYNALMNSEWFSYCAILFGNYGCGKTHLAHLWANNFNAKFLQYTEGCAEQLMYFSGIIEDVDKNMCDIREKELLHACNNAMENKNFLLLTSSVNPYEICFNLSDLLSRVQAMQAIRLGDPDEELLRVIIIKEFHVRGLRLDLRIINLMLSNLERNVYSITKFINFIDKESIKSSHPIGINYAHKMMKDFLGA